MPWMKTKTWAQVAIFIAVFFAISLWQTKHLLASGEAPTLEATTLDGRPFALGELKGKTVVLYFFAPWCGVCKMSASNGNWLRKIFDPENVVVKDVALSYESDASIGEFVASSDLPPDDVVKGSDEIQRQYGIEAFPTYYVLDSTGRVRFTSVGYSTFAGLVARTLLTRLVANL